MQTKATLNAQQNIEYKDKKQTVVKTSTDKISREITLKNNQPTSPKILFPKAARNPTETTPNRNGQMETRR